MGFVHICHENYEVGQTIRAGSMGRIIREQYVLFDTVSNQPLVWRLFQEQTFELIRRSEHPDLPSRMSSIFLFENFQEAQAFIKRDRRDGTNIYEVALVSPLAKIHRASMKLYDRVPLGRPAFPALEDQARQYWDGVNYIDPPFDFQPELLVESDVIVLSVLKQGE